MAKKLVPAHEGNRLVYESLLRIAKKIAERKAAENEVKRSEALHGFVPKQGNQSNMEWTA